MYVESAFALTPAAIIIDAKVWRASWSEPVMNMRAMRSLRFREWKQFRFARRGQPDRRMPIDLLRADFELSLDLYPDAPRSARELVGHIDCPSPWARDAAMLLTSELVTSAVHHRHPALGDAVKLRVWMPEDVVRVELQARSRELFRPWGDGPHYEQVLLDRLADRWSIETDQDGACAWFEIDQNKVRTVDTSETEALKRRQA